MTSTSRLLVPPRAGAPRPISSRLTRRLAIVTAIVLVVAWLAASWIMRGTFDLRRRHLAALGLLATIVIAASFAARSDRLRMLVVRLCGATIALVLAVFTLELVIRITGIDLARQEQAFKAVPIYFRLPRIPIGEAFFRREGPDAWHGKVLFPAMRLENVADDAYIDEQPLTVTYDKLGFRNPDDLTDWDVVVVGDSFTELGYLPYEDLFTTRAANLSGKKIKNLGVCHTGPLTHVQYLKDFGKSPATTYAVLAYFEGNDWIDIGHEDERLQHYRSTGQRPLRETVPQSSILKAAYQRATRGSRISHNAWFDARAGSIPVTIKYNPYDENDVSPLVRELLESAIAQWGNLALQQGMQPWLLYLPCKHRVIRRHIRFTDDARQFLVDWRPSDMPQYIERLCRENGIRFIDPTPKLMQCADEGRLPYNGIWDTHLNREGSYIVGDVLAEALRTADDPQ
jgi:hypothetical protein